MTTWRKSTYSGGNGSDCVEVAISTDSVLVRDTKARIAATLAIPSPAWTHFAAVLKA